MTDRAIRVGVLGAGAVGSHVGVRLSAGGLPVVLVDRPSRVAAGPPSRAIDHRGRTHRARADLVLTDDPSALAGVDICLVAVKSSSTDTVAGVAADALAAGTAVVSLQNGLRNPGRLRARLSPVIAAVVGFNVVAGPDDATTEAVPGTLYLGEGWTGTPARAIAAIAEALRTTGLPTQIRPDIDAVAAGKLLLNLNNGIGGATGLSIAQMLADADARACFSMCLLEGRRVLEAAGRPVARAGPLGATAVAWAMRLPTWLVRAASPVAADAVTSTLADLRRGRQTEIDELNGEIVALAGTHDIDAPRNRVVVEAVHAHERAVDAGRTPRWVPAKQLRREISRRRAATRGVTVG